MSELDDNIEAWFDEDLKIKEATERRDKLAALILGALKVGETRGGLTVQGPRRMFDPTLARQVLPDDLYQLTLLSKPDLRTATKNLPGDLVDQCKKSTGDPFLRRTP